MNLRNTLCTLGLVCAAGAVMVAAPQSASAQFRIGPQGGYNIDYNDGYVGLDMWIGLIKTGENTALNLSPSLSYFLTGSDADDAMYLDLDFLLASDSGGFANLFMGPGVFWDPLGDFNRGGINVNYGVMFLPENWINVVLEGRTRVDAEFEFSATEFGLVLAFAPGNREPRERVEEVEVEVEN